jgi:lysophosphatidylcholine acyltransferase/lyso-PAF acetyltransferase
MQVFAPHAHHRREEQKAMLLKWLMAVVDTRRWVCSIDDYLDPFPLAEKDDDDPPAEGKDESIHNKHKPFVRNDSYGVAGWHGPPFTLMDYLRVTGRAVAVAFVLATFTSFLFVTTVTRGNSRGNEIVSRWLPWYMQGYHYAAGFEALRVVGYRKDDNGDGNSDNKILVHPVAPVLVCNHVSYFDVGMLILAFFPSFIAKKSIRKLPIYGRLAVLIRTIFVNHGSTNKLQVDGRPSSSSVELISRIRLAAAAAPARDGRDNSNSGLPPVGKIAIFPEGTTTNGSYILPFRRGAFAAGLPVQPVLIQYSWTRFNLSWESIGMRAHIFRMLAQPTRGCTIALLPPILPPAALTEAIARGEDTFTSLKAREAVREFADQARAAIAKAGGLELSDLVYKDKQVYHKELREQGYY